MFAPEASLDRKAHSLGLLLRQTECCTWSSKHEQETACSQAFFSHLVLTRNFFSNNPTNTIVSKPTELLPLLLNTRGEPSGPDAIHRIARTPRFHSKSTRTPQHAS